jgi:hypothetical protein
MKGHERNHNEYVDGKYGERKNCQLPALARTGLGSLYANVVQGKSRHKKPPRVCTRIDLSKFGLGKRKAG